MADTKPTVTYAQYNEDIVLAALLDGVEGGFYVDVGANYPVIDSVTYHFYKQGWRGINIEPVKGLYEQLKKQRPKDINLQCGAGAKRGKAILREYVKVPGHSTFSSEMKEEETKLEYVEYEVDILPLKTIFADNKVEHIHFLKIDVEGYEAEVIAGNDWSKYRPEVLCIEANHGAEKWQKLIKDHDYRLFISDGLNEYYLSKESWHRTEGYAERVIKLDYHTLKQHQQQSWDAEKKHIEALEHESQRQKAKNDELNHRLNHISSLSLKDQPLRRRIKRAAYGLSVDWLRYKRGR